MINKDMTLIFIATTKMISYGKMIARLENQPKFSFAYDFLEFNTSTNIFVKTFMDRQTILSSSEIQEIQNFIQNYRYKVWRIGADGKCEGQFYIDECQGKLYAHCPPPNLPGNYYYNPENEQWDYIYGVDKSGKYIGNVPYTDCTYIASSQPNLSYETWDPIKKVWYDARTLDDIKLGYIDEINKTIQSLENWGTLYKGNVWSIKPSDVTALMSAPEDGTITSWKDNEGNEVHFTDYTISDVKKAVNDFFTELETKKSAAIAQVNACTTVEDVYKVKL